MTTKNQARHFSTSELFLTPLKEIPALEDGIGNEESEDEKRSFTRNALLLIVIAEKSRELLILWYQLNNSNEKDFISEFSNFLKF